MGPDQVGPWPSGFSFGGYVSTVNGVPGGAVAYQAYIACMTAS